jgi:hypothetical protein
VVPSASVPLGNTVILSLVDHALSISAQSSDHANHLKCAFKDVASINVKVLFVVWALFATSERVNAFARKTL